MLRRFLIILFFCFQLPYLSGQAEDTSKSILPKHNKSNLILDGVYIKETSITRIIEYNGNLVPFHHNPSFGMNREYMAYYHVFSPLSDNASTKSESTTYHSPYFFEINSEAPKSILKEISKNVIFVQPEKSRILKKISGIDVSKGFIVLDGKDQSQGYFMNSMRFFIDSSHISLNQNALLLELDTNFRIKKKNELLQPFYFSKYEVTNKEYREFVNWVRDSIAREILFEEFDSTYKKEIFNTKNNTSYWILDYTKPILWNQQEVVEALSTLHPITQSWRFNRKIDTRLLNYN